MARPPQGRPMTRGTTCPRRPFAATLGLVLGLALAALLPLVLAQPALPFSFHADRVGQFTYADEVMPLNTGTWSTHDTGAPSAAIRAPVAATSSAGGKAHHISFDLMAPDGDPMTYNLTYSYSGG